MSNGKEFLGVNLDIEAVSKNARRGERRRFFSGEPPWFGGGWSVRGHRGIVKREPNDAANSRQCQVPDRQEPRWFKAAMQRGAQATAHKKISIPTKLIHKQARSPAHRNPRTYRRLQPPCLSCDSAGWWLLLVTAVLMSPSEYGAWSSQYYRRREIGLSSHR